MDQQLKLYPEVSFFSMQIFITSRHCLIILFLSSNSMFPFRLTPPVWPTLLDTHLKLPFLSSADQLPKVIDSVFIFQEGDSSTSTTYDAIVVEQWTIINVSELFLFVLLLYTYRRTCWIKQDAFSFKKWHYAWLKFHRAELYDTLPVWR